MHLWSNIATFIATTANLSIKREVSGEGAQLWVVAHQIYRLDEGALEIANHFRVDHHEGELAPPSRDVIHKIQAPCWCRPAS